LATLPGAFHIGPSGILVGDQVYGVDEKPLVVRLAAAPGTWTARVEPAIQDRTSPHRTLTALHADVEEQDLVWRIVEARLCTDTCDVLIADFDFRTGADALLRSMGSGDGLIGSPEARGAKFVCCYDPWRCEVSAAERDGVVVGVRVRWFSSASETITHTYWIDGVEHWFKLEEGVMSVLNEQCWSLERSFDDFSWCPFDEGMDELRVPAELRPRLHAILDRHGAFFD